MVGKSIKPSISGKANITPKHITQRLICDIFPDFLISYIIDMKQNTNFSQEPHFHLYFDIISSTKQCPELKHSVYNVFLRRNMSNMFSGDGVHMSKKYSKFLVLIIMEVTGAYEILANTNFQITPNLVLLLSNGFEQSREDLVHLYRQFVSIPLTSIYLGLQNFSQLHMICFTCNEGFKMLNSAMVLSYPYLLSEWFHLHKNMQGAQLEAFPEPYQKWLDDVGSCDIHKTKDANAFAEMCVFKEAQKRLNFSFTISRERWKVPLFKRNHAVMYQRVFSFSGNLAELKEIGCKISGVLITFDLYKFYFVLNEQMTDSVDYNMLSLLHTLNTEAWLLILVIISTFSILIEAKGLLKTSAEKFKLIRIMRNCLAMSGTLVEQSIYSKFKRNMKNSAFILLSWNMWCYAALIMCNVYKGTLVSVMTRKSPTPVPRTLEALLASKLPLLTSDGDDGSYSLLKDYILPDIINATSTRASESNVFKKLQDLTMWMNLDRFTFIEKLAFRDYEIKLYKSNYTLKYDHEFAMIGSRGDVDSTSLYLKAFTRKFVSQSHPLDIFSFQLLAVKSNYFYPILIPIARQFEESGLYRRWIDFNEKMVTIGSVRSFEKYFREKTDEPEYANSTVYFNEKLLDRLYNFVFFRRNKDDEYMGKANGGESKSHAVVTFETQKAFFILFAQLLLFALVVYVLEIVLSKVYKNNHIIKI